MARVEVKQNGAIKLGDKVVADGHIFGINVRVQSHLHKDHTYGWKKSLFGKIYLSKPSKELLDAQNDPSKLSLENIDIIGLPMGIWNQLDSFSLFLQETNHMLGAVQIIVEDDTGRYGYSGDFTWPPPDNYKKQKIDELVLDATCNYTQKSLNFTQEKVNQEFRELISEYSGDSSIKLNAVRGTLERALGQLADLKTGPIIVDEKLFRTINVYKNYYSSFPSTIISEDSEDFQKIIDSGTKYIKTSTRVRKNTEPSFDGIHITCSAFSPQKDNPVRRDSDRSFTVAMTNHADVDGTIDYVESTGAKTVLVDSTRAGNAVQLAKQINDRLGLDGVRARPSP